MQVAPIDLEPFRFGGQADRAEVARRFDAAGSSSGFFAVTGHGVPQQLLDDMLDTTGAFFDLPIAEKMRYVVADRAANRGYAPEGSEALSYSLGEGDLPTDLFEAFNAGRELTDDDDVDDYVRPVRPTFLAPNEWPEQPARFRDVWLTYWEAAERTANLVMSLAAVALGLPDDFFVPSIDRSISVIRAVNYERRAGAADPVPGQMRMGAHTDYGSVTVLLADEVPGLQIRSDDGAWVDVVPPRGTLIVNIGDLLAEWTNDRWRSTMHRVLPPPATAEGPVRRRSVAWFQQPNWDAIIACLPTCCSDANPPRYRPVQSGEHLMAKLMGPRLLRPSELSPAFPAPQS